LFRPFLKTLTWRSGLVLAGSGGICQAYAKGPSFVHLPGRCPLKPSFGLSGAVRAGQSLAAALSWFRVVYSDSIFTVPDSRLLVLDQPFNIPTLNFAKNAKFRMGRPRTPETQGPLRLRSGQALHSTDHRFAMICSGRDDTPESG
jgi:hypothetical protein